MGHAGKSQRRDTEDAVKYIKIAIAGAMTVVSAAQYFIYGFLGFMLVWFLFCLIYLAISIYQRLHFSSVGSQVFTLILVALPLFALIFYEVHDGFPNLTHTFYILFIALLALAFVWEIVSLCLVLKARSDERHRKDRKQ